MPPSARPDFGLPEQGAIGEHTTQASGYHPGIRVQFPSLPARGRRGRRAKTVLADCEDRILRPRWISCGETEQPMSSFVPLLAMGAAPSSKPSDGWARAGAGRRGGEQGQHSHHSVAVTVRIQAEFRVTPACGR